MCPPGSWTCPPEEFPPGDMSIPCAGMGVDVFLHRIGRRLLSADEFRRGLPQHGARTGFGGLSLGFELPRERGRQTHRQRGCHNRGYQFWVLPTRLDPAASHSTRFASFRLPRLNRSAIHVTVITVSAGNRRAIVTLPASPFARFFRSGAPHRSHGCRKAGRRRGSDDRWSMPR